MWIRALKRNEIAFHCRFVAERCFCGSLRMRACEDCGRWRGVLIGEGTGESDVYRQAGEDYDDDVMAPVSGGAHSRL